MRSAPIVIKGDLSVLTFSSGFMWTYISPSESDKKTYTHDGGANGDRQHPLRTRLGPEVPYEAGRSAYETDNLLELRAC